MQTKEICDFFSQESRTVITNILRQHWNKDKYSYMSTPRPDYGIMLLISGSARFIFEGGALQVSAGDLVFIPKSSRYEAVFENEIEDYLVNFNIDDGKIDIKSPTLVFGNSPISIYECFDRLVDESKSPLNTTLRSKACFYLLLDEIVKNANMIIHDGYDVIDKAKRLLNAENEYSVEDIAGICGISSSGLRKKFKDSEGITPSEYRCLQKINKAKYLLESTNMSISEISDALNFYDAPYFCRIFKKHEGVSPKSYINNNKL